MRRPATSCSPGSGKGKATGRTAGASSPQDKASIGSHGAEAGDAESQLPLESDEEALQQF
jgi:hypothetical protein